MNKQLDLAGFIGGTKDGFKTKKSYSKTIKSKRDNAIRTIDKHLNGERKPKMGSIRMEEVSENGKTLKVCIPYGTMKLKIFKDASGNKVEYGLFNLEDVTRKAIWNSIKDYINAGNADEEIEHISSLWGKKNRKAA